MTEIFNYTEMRCSVLWEFQTNDAIVKQLIFERDVVFANELLHENANYFQERKKTDRKASYSKLTKAIVFLTNYMS